TGHYARLENNLIKTAVDESKDQSYFLASADKEALKYLIFPLGEMKKEDVKKFASTIEVLKSFATQKESSEICFVEDTYVQVLDQFMDTKIPGEVLDSSGKVVGKHEGYMHYTIGKRRGFEVRGAHEPHFVLKINPKQNQIIVGTKEELKISEFNLKNINLFIDAKELDCEVKIRYRSKSTPCKVEIYEDKSAKIILKDPVYGLASGQMAVFYDHDKVIASGFIE
ncbi:tRNA 2-thiouridine(34) synthase MnmA, partial [Campylobacter coli]|nr:tRNA 2-thiouridine(34) synthase MnmA [Campylobacter coli]